MLRPATSLRKKRLLFFLGMALVSALLLVTCWSFPRNQKRWNCLLITVDTWRADRLGRTGPKGALTPAFDALAREGVLFTRAFAHTTTTLPSHANILLGVLPPYHGVHDNANFVVPRDIPNLAQLFQDHGFATAAFVGAYPLDKRFGLNQGFDVYDDAYGNQDFSRQSFVERPAEEVVRRARDWLRKRPGGWFLWVHCFDPHYPYEPPEPYRTAHADEPYDGEVAYVDGSLARLFDDLRKDGLWKDTVVVLTSDHGESLGEHGEKTHGYYAYNSTLHVPLVIGVPGMKAGRVATGVVSHIDIFPTVCDLFGFKKPAHLQGRSLVPAMNGKTGPDVTVYFESLYPHFSRGWAPLYGYIRYPEKYIHSPIPELYDLREDFGEKNNLAGGRDLAAQEKTAQDLIRAHAAEAGADARPSRAPSGESLKKLRSLGYVAGAGPSGKRDYGPEEDVKNLLPYDNRASEAMDMFTSGRVDAAVESLQANLNDQKSHDLSYTYLAAIYQELGKPEAALSLLRQGLEIMPGNYTIFLSYISTLLDSGRYLEVLDALDRFKFPQAEHDPEIWNSFGAAHAGLGRFDEAIPFYEQAIAVDDDFPAALTNLGVAYLMKARVGREGEYLAKAVESFERAIEKNPKHAAAFNGLGAAHKMRGEVEKTIAAWQEALACDPGLDTVLYNLGFAYLEKGDKAAALEYLVRYKERAYLGLPPAEKEVLDELIRRAR